MTILCSEGQYDNARAQLPDLCHQRQRRTPRHRLGLQHMGRRSGRPVSLVGERQPRGTQVLQPACNDVYDKRDFICEGSSIHADGENDPQYALSKPRPNTMLAAWKNWRSTKAADSRTGAQGRTRARNNALWTVLAVLTMESINEEKTSLYKKRRLPYDCIHRKILHIHHWHRRFSACFLLHCLRTAGK